MLKLLRTLLILIVAAGVIYVLPRPSRTHCDQGSVAALFNVNDCNSPHSR
jgi:hypothetical protein